MELELWSLKINNIILVCSDVQHLKSKALSFDASCRSRAVSSCSLVAPAGHWDWCPTGMASLEDRLALLQDDVVADYFAMLREAEAHRPHETAAAVRIQSAWRGFFLRCSLARLAATCTVIQRCYRGHLGRQYAAACRRQNLDSAESSMVLLCRPSSRSPGRVLLLPLTPAAVACVWQRDRALRLAYFHAAATVIQRHFRGFHSRKYRHSYYARAAYIAAVLHTTERLRAHLQESYEQQAADAAAAVRATAAAQYQAVLRQSHHLVSTRSCPGVFRAPRHAGGVPALDGLSVEEHLWHTVHTAGRPGSATGTSTSSSHSGSLSEPPSAPSSAGQVERAGGARVQPLDLAPLRAGLLQAESSLARSTSRGASISDLIQRAADYETALRATSPGEARGRGTVQAASPYAAVEDRERLERQQSARLAVSPRPFLTAVGADRLNTENVNGAGISQGTRYGIQEEAQKLERANSERLMRQISPKPFKVAARPRQLFEDAAERVVVL
ncbi:hypothetical protein KFL_001870090 [Klebsormidium nitens]|uniref:IQ calmodulin-binding motif family protein n=1 Tax=Klebsormidium nitens TaxID=105231 RepID=A0A1Y1I6N7_KLENI|nr:hypothetical protein KFL_001870090 [Klebsormidium nitens]|eukprot:GAQ84387.1 hypothetical protein KFL_001870090 [Klebsormidium nitens]